MHQVPRHAAPHLAQPYEANLQMQAYLDIKHERKRWEPGVSGSAHSC